MFPVKASETVGYERLAITRADAEIGKLCEQVKQKGVEMAQTLDEFIKEAKNDLSVFECWWRKKNQENPEKFPMEMTTGNEGLWWEFLQGNIDDE